jgi:hypothetical protein
MTDHTDGCDWHVDQYPWECTSGVVYRQHRDRIEALTAENERLAEALLAVDEMFSCPKRINSRTVMRMVRAALQGAE